MAGRILIAEDEALLRGVLATKLTRLGYKVLEASDGVEALTRLRTDKPDLLLLDIVMPKLNGFDVLEALRADTALRATPVIIISNSGQPVEIERTKRLGAVDYLVKAQFDPDELVTKVVAQIGKPDESMQEEAKSAEKSDGAVLLVEDDKFLRDLISQKLRNEGFAVSEAIDGEEGMRKLKEESPDIVLLDLILPGMDGFELLKRAKEDVGLARIPVIILSNLGQREDIERGMKLGAHDFLIKAHFTPGEIIAKVRATIESVKK